jgi:acetyl esterase/lipase
MFLRSCLLWLLSFIVLPGVLGAVEVTKVEDVEIGQVGDRALHAELVFPTKRPDKPMPVALWIHGGGWKSGSYKGNAASWLAQEGYFTASIEYRLSGEAPWPAQLEDCQAAVRWVRSQAETYGLDPNRIVVLGASAGGHLAACLGTMGDGGGGQVQAVVSFCPPTDFTTGKTVYGWALGPLFRDPELKNTEAQKSASPLYHVKAGLPPFLIFHGDKDPTVPIDEAVRLNDALREAGGQSKLVVVAGGDHGFGGPKGQPVPQPDGAARQAMIREFLQDCWEKSN